MNMENTEKKKSNWLGLVIGIGVSILAVALLINLINFELTIEAIKKADFKFMLISVDFAFKSLDFSLKSC